MSIRRFSSAGLVPALGCAALVALGSPACAQVSSSGSSMGSSSSLGKGSTGSSLGSTSSLGSSSTSSSGSYGSAGSAFGNTGGTGGTGRGGAGGANSTLVPSTSNPFVSTYANPMAIGLGSATGGSSGTSQNSFGQPLYATVATSAQNLAAAVAAANAAAGFTTYGMVRVPAYITTVGDDLPLVVHAPVQLQRDLKQVLLTTSALKMKNNIEVTVDGSQVVVLRGQVGSERERRLAEGLIRLTPGVRAVENNLEVIPTR